MRLYYAIALFSVSFCLRGDMLLFHRIQSPLERVVVECMRLHELLEGGALDRLSIINHAVDLHEAAACCAQSHDELLFEDLQYVKFWFDAVATGLSSQDFLAEDICLNRVINESNRLLFSKIGSVK
jgi:hypothetical protein